MGATADDAMKALVAPPVSEWGPKEVRIAAAVTGYFLAKMRGASPEELEALHERGLASIEKGDAPLTEDEGRAFLESRRMTKRERITFLRFCLGFLEEEGTLNALRHTPPIRQAMAIVRRAQRSRSSKVLRRGTGSTRATRHRPGGHVGEGRGPPLADDDPPAPRSPTLPPCTPDAQPRNARTPVEPAALPEILSTEDLARVFGFDVATARRHLARGDFGPHFRIGKRKYVLRESLLAHLAAQSAHPNAPARRRRKIL